MLIVMLRSGFVPLAASRAGGGKNSSPKPAVSDTSLLVMTMAATQVILTVSAITSYHVQIINRISSGYPVWYWWLARSLGGTKTASLGANFVVFMIMYAAIQGALFASFLPPA
jgi:GPI mannosyltransferase 2